MKSSPVNALENFQGDHLAHGTSLLLEAFEKFTNWQILGRWEKLKIHPLQDFITQFHLPIDLSALHQQLQKAPTRQVLRTEIEKILVRAPALRREYEQLLELMEKMNNSKTPNPAVSEKLLLKKTRQFIDKYAPLSCFIGAASPSASISPLNLSASASASALSKITPLTLSPNRNITNLINNYQNNNNNNQNNNNNNNPPSAPPSPLFTPLSSLFSAPLLSEALSTPPLSNMTSPTIEESPKQSDTVVVSVEEINSLLEAASISLPASPPPESPLEFEGLHVVLDLDETLIRYTEQPGEVINFHSYSKLKEGSAWILLRSYAVEFIINLLAMNCRVYILTAGTQAYCDLVWGFLKTHLSATVSLELLDKVVAKSCRDESNEVMLKDFHMVGIPAEQERFALAVDNNRMAWSKQSQDHVVVIPDWTPETMGEEDQFTFGQVKQRIDQVLHNIQTHPFPVQAQAWQILKSLYEEEEKMRMKQNARSAMRSQMIPTSL